MKCRKLKIFEHFRKKQSFFQKKGQVEILGLMIIMVLISLGILFAVKYVFLAPKADIKQEFTQKNIAQNMLSVMLDTNTECKDQTIQNLLIDCNTYNDGSIGCTSSFYSCDFVEEEINNIFDKTLRKWGNDFYFEAGDIKINKPCLKGKKTGTQPLYDLTIRLEICD